MVGDKPGWDGVIIFAKSTDRPPAREIPGTGTPGSITKIHFK